MSPQLNAEKRDIFGKKLKISREQGKLPAVFYGKGRETVPLFVNMKEFEKIWKKAGESTLIELNKDKKKIADVLINDVAIDPLSDLPLHVDFYAVEMDKLIRTKIPLVFEGVAPAVKELGGILVKVIHEIEIEALPKDLPHEFKIDVSKIATFDDHITVKDIKAPAGVKIIAKPEEVIVLAELPKEEIEQPTITIDQVEVEKKGKKPVEGEEGEEEVIK